MHILQEPGPHAELEQTNAYLLTANQCPTAYLPMSDCLSPPVLADAVCAVAAAEIWRRKSGGVGPISYDFEVRSGEEDGEAGG